MQRSILFDARLVLSKPTGIGQYIVALLAELIRLAPEIHFQLLRHADPWPGYELAEWPRRSNPSDQPDPTHDLAATRSHPAAGAPIEDPVDSLSAFRCASLRGASAGGDDDSRCKISCPS